MSALAMAARGGGLVDGGFAGDGEVVDGAGFAAGGVVDLGDGVVVEQVFLASGEPEVVADVSAGFVGPHAVHVLSDGYPLVKGYLELRVSLGCDLRRPVVDSVADGTLAA